MFSSPRGRTEGRRGSASTERNGSPTSSSAGTSATTASRFDRLQSHVLTSLLSLNSIPPPDRLPVVKNKVGLSIPVTTRNFRGFVQKSGPVFLIQDTVIETLMWDHPSRTLCVMGIWAVIAMHPYLLVPLPPFTLSLLLLQTYQARYPSAPTDPDSKTVTPARALEHSLLNPTTTGHAKTRPPVVPEPPHEGSVKYYENLRDIQNMMKMITDAYDLLAPFAVHLNWSQPAHTLFIFQLLIVSTIGLFFIAPYLPYRLILLIAGEGAFIINHPWTEPVVTKLIAKLGQGREGRRLKDSNRRAMAQLTEWIKMDQLPDEVWLRGWREVEVFENERYAHQVKKGEHKWTGHHLRYGERKPWTKGADGYADDALHVEGYTLDISRQIAMTLEDGWSWVDGDDWRIDFLGRWSAQGVDEEGWLYTNSDWASASPYAFGHPGHPMLPPSSTSGISATRLSALDSDDEEGDGDGSAGFNADGADDHGYDLDGLPHDPDLAGGGSSSSGGAGGGGGGGGGAGGAGSRGKPRAETRKRRWLRRAVFTGAGGGFSSHSSSTAAGTRATSSSSST